ncbi:MAG: BMP family ABC transporter substrate-binding protein [Lachnospiraceae bacterium]|jgi:basic membrane lipoprotein Med (substrate-binding protein (PBP1-ABC) superfamily)|nr:BMP family ABC transporter substrate-binding protein [Lachnospiraceae bacterium]
MAYEDYMKAQKMGLKAYKSATSKGQYPYLPVLDDILSHSEIECEVRLGVSNIPLYQVVGTSTAGRTQAFANNFMPLLDYGSEFSAKWSHLVDAQIEEGIHDAVKVYEYMNRYYVVEGNKRVSVLKYFDSPSILADVTRKVPKKTDDEEVLIYYEFMDFYDLTKINYLAFSKLGSYPKLIETIGKKPGEKWSDDDLLDFSSFHTAFYNAYKEKGGRKLSNITCDDIMLYYLSLYPYSEAMNMPSAEIKKNLDKIWPEIVLLQDDDSVELLMNPNEETHAVKTVLNKIKTLKKRKVAFVYDKEPSSSDWVYGHELGRLHLEENLGEIIETKVYITNGVDDNAENILEAVCSDGNEIIFATTPKLIKACVKVAANHPDVKILNCSLNSSHATVRTYYTRMYEAKFLTGIIAGALCSNDKIGYVDDYPIFGEAANINAFALGAKMVNPRATVYLAWSTMKDFDVNGFFKERGISYISSQDSLTPENGQRRFGLYAEKNDEKKNIAVPIYHWGALYEELINSIFKGAWKDDESDKAINYWWGLSAGVIDIIYSNNLPVGVSKLVELMKKSISSGIYHPFSGPLTDQNGLLKCDEYSVLRPEEIMTMDWLNENVIGSIPNIDDLIDSAKEVVSLRGLDAATPDKGGASLL